MRPVFDALDRLGIRYYVTGSVAASVYGVLRQTHDRDAVLVWVASVEDLVLAKLAWSEGTSELQLRDCEQLLRLNARTIDRSYLERWATKLGLIERWKQVLDAV